MFEAPDYIKENLAKGLGRVSDEDKRKIMQTENIDKAVDSILNDFTSEEIAEQIDEQMFEYVDSDWEEDGYESEYDWYCDHCNGEAESDVIRDAINGYEGADELTKEEYCEVYDILKDRWCL